MSQFTDYTPLPTDWTVVEESAEASAFDVREVVPVPRTSVHPPTSPISTRAENDMSLTLFSETDVVQSETSEVVVNDENFQLEELQDAIEELKKENVDLTEENKDLRATCSSLLSRIDELTSQKYNEERFVPTRISARGVRHIFKRQTSFLAESFAKGMGRRFACTAVWVQ